MRRRAHLRFAVVVSVWLGWALAVAPAPALAQDAAALIEEGIALREQGRDAEALRSFRAAYAMQPSGQALGQIALAQQALGQWVMAEQNLSQALKLGGAWVARHRQRLDQALAFIRQHLAWLTVTSNVPGAEVRVFGEVVATTPMPRAVRVPAGRVTVEVAAPGYEMAKRELVASAGQQLAERVVLARSPRPRASAPATQAVAAIAGGGRPPGGSTGLSGAGENLRPQSPTPASSSVATSTPEATRAPASPEPGPVATTPGAPGRPLGPAVLWVAAGGAGLAGAGLGLAALAERSDVEQACGPDCSDAQVSKLSRLALGADLTLGLAAACALSGTLWYLLRFRGRRSGSPRAARRLQLAAGVWQYGAGLSLGGAL